MKSFKTSHLGKLTGKAEDNNHYYSSGKVTGAATSVAD